MLPTLSHNRQAPYSRFFIYVWAYEQGGMSKREMGSAAGASASASAPKDHEQDRGRGEKQEQEHEQEADEPGQTGGKNPEGGSVSGSGFGSVSGDTNIVQDVAGVGGRIQDVLVPWVLKSNSTNSKRKTKSSSSSKSTPKSKSTIDGTQTSQGTTTNTDAGEEPEGGEEEEEKVYHRYYHLFVRGELRELINEAGIAEGYRIIPSTSTSTFDTIPLSAGIPKSESEGNSDIPLSSLSISPSTSSIPTTTTIPSLGEELGRDDKWLRIRGEGWEADNWWVEAEVGVGPIVD